MSESRRMEEKGRVESLFISYRSLDVHLVRPVAELLMASGVPVWFAEYEILLGGRSDFRAMFLAGARKATHALAFTRPDYWTSEHTCTELDALIESETKILNIRVHPSTRDDAVTEGARRLFDGLSAGAVAYLDCNGTGKPARILRFVKQQFNLSLSKIEPIQASHRWPREFFLGRADSFLLDVGDWRVVDARHGADLDIRMNSDPVPSHMRWRMADAPPDYSRGISVSAGVEGSILLQQRREGIPLVLQVVPGPWSSNAWFRAIPLNDQRKAFEALAQVAADYFEQVLGKEHECVGAHLVILGEDVHLAFTYSCDGGRYWARKYVIRASCSGELIELPFTFQAGCSFEHFLRLIPLADEVVSSLKWSPSKRDLFGKKLLAARLLSIAGYAICGIVSWFVLSGPLDLPPGGAGGLSVMLAVGGGLTLGPIGRACALRMNRSQR